MSARPITLREMSKRMTWIFVAVALSAVAYYVAAFGIGHDTISSTTRFRIILGMLFAQSVGLIALASVNYGLLVDLRSYHLAASHVATLRGMWRSLDLAAAHGGLTAEARSAIYKEAETAFALYDQASHRE